MWFSRLIGQKRPAVWVTRPRVDSRTLVSLLARAGHRVLAQPLLFIKPVRGAKSQLAEALSYKPQAILITSANGVRALAKTTRLRDIPLITVGQSSESIAREHGFTNVTSAALDGTGDSKQLAKHVTDYLLPEGGELLHISGSHVAGDLSEILAERGYHLRRLTLYHAQAAKRLPRRVARALREQQISDVMLYSTRTAKICVELLAGAGLNDSTKSVNAICLSQQVANVLKPSAWKHIRVLESSRDDHVLAAIGGAS